MAGSSAASSTSRPRGGPWTRAGPWGEPRFTRRPDLPFVWPIAFAAPGALALIAAAMLQLWRFRSAIMSQRDASHLLEAGLFALSHDPIYLGMAPTLTGVVLALDAALVPLHALLVHVRVVRGEEAALARLFPGDFARYRAAIRPWI